VALAVLVGDTVAVAVLVLVGETVAVAVLVTVRVSPTVTVALIKTDVARCPEVVADRVAVEVTGATGATPRATDICGFLPSGAKARALSSGGEAGGCAPVP
jgi:hypothetical protein